jgi:hypothetical protein
MDSEFDPPTLGVTFLGTSHGFDEKGNTTGFIIWINGGGDNTLLNPILTVSTGILVDPPPITTAYLKEHGIPGNSTVCIL